MKKNTFSTQSNDSNAQKRALVVASVASMIEMFNADNIRILRSLGYQVDVAANFCFGSTYSQERVDEYRQKLVNDGTGVYHVPIPRSPLMIYEIGKSYRLIKELVKMKEYQIVHCHSPIGGMVCRYACCDARRRGTKIIYTAHGFHFYKGAPIRNWIFFPMELFLAKRTDVLVTITREDYILAKRFFRAGDIAHIYGVGIDIGTQAERVKHKEMREKVRKELGVRKDDKLLLSVGELNENKNFGKVIKALYEMKRDNANEEAGDQIKYVICGIGKKENTYRRMIRKYGMQDQVMLLGFQNDLPGFYAAADLFILPSKREGISVALMEAMAAKCPVLCSDIRGNRELVEDRRCRFSVAGEKELKEKLVAWRQGKLGSNVEANYENLKRYDRHNVKREMKKIYEKV